jgi:hypothetical protein
MFIVIIPLVNWSPPGSGNFDDLIKKSSGLGAPNGLEAKVI